MDRAPWVQRAGMRATGWIRSNRALFAMIVGYAVVLGSVSTYRFYTGQTYAWDLGIMQQALYSTDFGGKWFYYTPELFTKNPSGSFFGVHFSLLMFPLAGFYRIFPSGPALLCLQAIVVASAALPLHRVLRALALPAPNVFALVYLVSPLTVLSTLYDFHLEAFLPLGVFLLILGLVRRHVLLTVAATLFLFTIYEYGALLAICCVLFYGLLEYRTVLHVLAHPRATDSRTRTWGLLLTSIIVASIGFYVAAFQVINWVNPTTATLNGAYGPTQLTFSISQILSVNWGLKLLYFGLALAVLAFLPLFDPRALVLVAPFAIPAFFGHPAYYLYGYQYGFLVIPGYVIAAAMGFRRVEPRLRRLRRLRVLPRLVRPGMVAGSVTSIVVVVAIASIGSPPVWAGTGAVMHLPTAWNSAEYKLVELIPAGASVLVDDNAFPWVANNLHAYVIPLEPNPAPISFYSSMASTLAVDPQYILLNTVQFGLFPFFQNFSGYIHTNYGVLAEDAGNVLLERNYSGSISFYDGYTRHFDASSFSPSRSRTTYYWSGPFTELIVGHYNVTVTYSSNETTSMDGWITAFGGGVVLGFGIVHVHATTPGTSGSFTLPFTSPALWDGVEFLVDYTASESLQVQGATLVQTSA